MIPARATVTSGPISSDPYTNATSQHDTEVEPDTLSVGSTVVAAFQAGRFFDGGASNIGWATSTNGGSTWVHGFLPSTTVFAAPPGPYDRVSDPSVAYDRVHHVWLISSLALTAAPSVRSPAILVSSSSDAKTWNAPVAVATTPTGDYDKNWIVCDQGTDVHSGNCYLTWDDYGRVNRLLSSTSSDGGRTWGTPRATVGNARGIGGQPLVEPDGTIVVPFSTNQDIYVYRSTNGGKSWSAPTPVAVTEHHSVAGKIRESVLPSAEIAADGTIYVAWPDCRFRTGCASNDIVYTSSSDRALTWTPARRVPIDDPTSTVDHFFPGVGVDQGSSGSSKRLAVLYYFYPKTNCTASTCRLGVGIIKSADGGVTWSAPIVLSSGMLLSWLARTTQGPMVGDYFSVSWSRGHPVPVYVVAKSPVTPNVLNEAATSASGV